LNQRIRTTIIRYISSKNLSKDAVGINQLTSNDIQSIEKGIANINENKTGLISRLYGLKFQLQNNEDPNGHSLLQRLEFWRAAISIVKNNWLIGVGTGDVQIAFNKEYSLNDTKLKPENRLRAHNYYLTNIITFGIVGLIIFCAFLIVFIRFQLKNKNILGLLFISVFCVTAIIEDTIETQLGATIFAFFIAIYSMRKQEINV
jgi:O-antigen ligase